MSTVDRRTLLKTAGAVAAGAAIGSSLTARNAFATRTDTGVSVYAFPLSAVTLQAGPFLDNMNRTLAYLSFVDIDRLLYNFRVNVGITTSATPCGGWESPSTELRGHSVGHLLSALAQAYGNTRNSAYKTKGDALVSALATCQAASPSRGYRTGYLSAFPENFFDRLESGQSVWAPYYTIHKIMAGLLDQYLIAGNTQALTVVTAMAAWVKARTDPLSTTTMQNVVLRTEFGGMPEVLTNLYQVSGNADQLTTAQRFDHQQIQNPLAANTDALSGFHANTQIPKIIGAIREYHATGTTRYRDIAINFWDIVTRHHTYVNGGNSNGEYFQTPDAIAGQLSDTTCECCNTYNMLKLTRQLFFTNPARADYVDYYENALFNQILGQQDPASSHGFVTYYTPLRAGGIKTYTNDYNDFTCDHGTGMESNTKYADSVYFYSGETLYVNLFIASTLTWPGRGITVTQATSFPSANSTRLTVGGSGHIALKVRVPSWSTSTTIALNGVSQTVTATPGSYATLDRTWTAGDVVDVSFGAALTFPRANDNANVGAVKYGAILYAGEYGNTDLGGALPTLQTGTVAAAGTLHFTGTASTGQVSLIPFYKTHHERYTVYWNLAGAGSGSASYEAESAMLAGQAAVRSSAGASGGALVGYIGNGTANYLRFGGVSVTRAGSHSVTVYYASGAARSVTMTVNGVAGPTVSTPSTGGWDTVGSVSTTVNLNAGTNIIQLGNTTGWAPDVDRIVVGA